MFEDYPIYHTISYGDTLYTLAREYGTTVHDILNSNSGINPYNLRIGEVITIFPNTDMDVTIHTPPYSNTPLNTNLANTSVSHANCISKMQLDLTTKMRLFWSQHVYWTRLLIISIAQMLNDTDNVTTRVLQTAKNISSLFAPYYGPQVAETLEKLLTDHLVVGKNLILAVVDRNAQDVEKYNNEWYENADKIVDFLNTINPSHFKEDEVRRMFYKHLDLTKEVLSHRINHNYSEDINTFNKVESEAMMMADYFVNGIVKQFPDRFTS